VTDISFRTITAKFPPFDPTVNPEGACPKALIHGTGDLSIVVKGKIDSSETLEVGLESLDRKTNVSGEKGFITVESRRPISSDFARKSLGRESVQATMMLRAISAHDHNATHIISYDISAYSPWFDNLTR
jgi:hypothetical protein